jgi:hypothetical protein
MRFTTFFNRTVDDLLNQRRIVDRLSVGFDGSQWGANGPELLTQAGHCKTRQCMQNIIFLDALQNPQSDIAIPQRKNIEIRRVPVLAGV